MISFFTNIWSWLTNPKNRSILKLIAIAILILIILMQCSQNRGLKGDLEQQKTETQRIQNNYEALHTPLIQGKINDSTLRAERLGLKLSLDELKKNYSDLLIGFEEFKKQTPKVIEKLTINNIETIKEVPVYAKIDSLGDGALTFNDSVNFADGNFRRIQGTLPVISRFYNKKDSTQIDLNKLGLYEQLNPGAANFNLEQKIKLKVGLFEDPKTNKVMIAATTSYPGISFTQLDGADIMDNDISKKAARNFRKTWGIGLSIGYGAAVNLKTNQMFLGPQIGIGLNYTPKWLQWGK
jgi:hypothetical protein